MLNKNKFTSSYILLKHFLLRLINNNILRFGNQRRESLIVILTLFAVFGGMITHILLRSYLGTIEPDIGKIWLEKTYFITFIMILMGVISVIVWESMFIDRVDYQNLLGLPLKLRGVFFSKFLSLLIFLGLISLVFNLFSTIIFSLYLSRSLDINPFYFGASFFLANFLANVFIFFLVALIHGIIRVFTNESWLKRISTFVQVFLFLAFLSIFLWFPQIFAWLPEMKERFSSFVFLFPPLWFVGLSEKMMGSHDLVFTAHQYILVIALLVPIGVYFFSFYYGYRKFLKTVYSGKKNIISVKFGGFFQNIFNSLFLKEPVQKSIFYFFIKTLRRNRKHILFLVLFLLITIGLIIGFLVYIYFQRGLNYFRNINIYLLSVPLMINFFLILGLRISIRFPVKIGANWIFKLTEVYEKKHYIIGMKKALVFYFIFPFFVLTFFASAYFWGFKAGCFHAFFSFISALLLIEIVFIDFRNIPYTSSLRPIKPKIVIFTLLGLLGFIEYTIFFSVLGLFLIENPIFYLIFFLVVFMIFILLKWYQRVKFKEFSFSFVE